MPRRPLAQAQPLYAFGPCSQRALQRSSCVSDLSCHFPPTFHSSLTLVYLTQVHIDQEDESLNRWKASLGLPSGPAIAVDPNDKRKCVIKALALEVEGRPDIVVDLTAPGSVEALKDKPFTIKEGARFRMKAKFVVQHEVLSGLKYIQVVKRKGIKVSKDQEMIVGFSHSLLPIEHSH